MQPTFDYSILRQLIKTQCGSIAACADQAGISRAALYRRLSNRAQWTLDDMSRVAGVVGIAVPEAQRLFFTRSI